MTEKKYLKWYNKVGYGSGDVAGNGVYAFLSTFVMLYLTNTVGLNPGIVGTLIAVSKLFDGVTDIFFGSMIDKTKTKMGKAKPWMLYGYIGWGVSFDRCICNSGKSWTDSAVCMVLYCIFPVKCSVLYSK